MRSVCAGWPKQGCCGQVRAAQPIRELRQLLRYRKAQIAERQREANRLHKALEDTGIKLNCVATDILGVSGRAMLKALVAGTTDAVVLAELRSQPMPAARRRRRPAFLESLPKEAVVAKIGALRRQFSKEIMRVARPHELHLTDGWWELFGDVYPDWGPETEHRTLTTKAAHDEGSRLARDYEQGAGASCQVHVGDDRAVFAAET